MGGGGGWSQPPESSRDLPMNFEKVIHTVHLLGQI